MTTPTRRNTKVLVDARAFIRTHYGQDNSVVIPRVFIDWCGDMNTAALLAQILYWSERATDPDGWFYKSYAEWEDELGLTEYQARRSSKSLVQMGVGLETKVKKANGNPTVHYRIDPVLFLEQLAHYVDPEQVEDLQDGNQSFLGNGSEDPKGTKETEDSQGSSNIDHTKTTSILRDDESPRGAPPKPKRKPAAKKPTTPASVINPFKDRIAELFNLSWETMTKSEKGRIQTAAKQLVESGATLDDLPVIYDYCQRHYDSFSPVALTTNKAAALEEHQKRHQPGGFVLTPEELERKRQRDEAEADRVYRERQKLLEGLLDD